MITEQHGTQDTNKYKHRSGNPIPIYSLSEKPFKSQLLLNCITEEQGTNSLLDAVICSFEPKVLNFDLQVRERVNYLQGTVYLNPDVMVYKLNTVESPNQESGGLPTEYKLEKIKLELLYFLWDSGVYDIPHFVVEPTVIEESKNKYLRLNYADVSNQMTEHQQHLSRIIYKSICMPVYQNNGTILYIKFDCNSLYLKLNDFMYFRIAINESNNNTTKEPKLKLDTTDCPLTVLEPYTRVYENMKFAKRKLIQIIQNELSR